MHVSKEGVCDRCLGTGPPREHATQKGNKVQASWGPGEKPLSQPPPLPLSVGLPGKQGYQKTETMHMQADKSTSHPLVSRQNCEKYTQHS